jgi:hypothetical protein
MTDAIETPGKRAGKIREIDTIAKRVRLPARKNPYWQGISGGRGGVSLGYRKGAAGGVWVVKKPHVQQEFIFQIRGLRVHVQSESLKTRQGHL